MPRLPTIRVIGSQFISTTLGSCVVVMADPSPSSPGLLVAGQQLGTLRAPLGLLVRGLGGESAQGPDHGPVHAAGRGRDLRSRWLVHEGHELVREAGHGAGDTDAAHVGAPAHAVDPAALGHVALDHRAPAAQLDQALGGAVLGGEVALLVVAGPAWLFGATVHEGCDRAGRSASSSGIIGACPATW